MARNGLLAGSGRKRIEVPLTIWRFLLAWVLLAWGIRPYRSGRMPVQSKPLRGFYRKMRRFPLGEGESDE
ncbi:MAG: hypothetical protein ACKN9U_12115, partial [Pirellulaceae bacterium]